MVNGGPAVLFDGLGDGSDVALLGLAGDDSFAATQVANWAIDAVLIDGTELSGADQFQLLATEEADALAYTPLSTNSAMAFGHQRYNHDVHARRHPMPRRSTAAMASTRST